MRRRNALWIAAVALGLCACGDGPATSSAGAGVGGKGTTSATGGGGAGGGGTGGNGGAGGVADPALDKACTPTFTLELQDMGPNGKLFTDAVPSPEAFVQQIGRGVCKILYRKPGEVRAANHITLIIKDDPIPGWKSGDVGDITVMISSGHLADIAAQGGDVALEIEGILYHEMTHMYQNDDKSAGEGTYPNLGNVIEGVADFVRIRAGFPPSGAKPSKAGAWDDQGYWKPAFFLLWIDDQYPDFLYRLNLSMIAGDGKAWSPGEIGVITGKPVDALWSDFASAACCAGASQGCCK